MSDAPGPARGHAGRARSPGRVTLAAVAAVGAALAVGGRRRRGGRGARPTARRSTVS